MIVSFNQKNNKEIHNLVVLRSLYLWKQFTNKKQCEVLLKQQKKTRNIEEQKKNDKIQDDLQLCQTKIYCRENEQQLTEEKSIYKRKNLVKICERNYWTKKTWDYVTEIGKFIVMLFVLFSSN